MTESMFGIKTAWKKQAGHFLLSGLVFFAVTMPFRYYFSLMEVTEIRPAAVLPPFFGMVYGFWGAMGCGVANFAADLLSGYSLSMSICSLPVQFLMGMAPCVMWYGIPAWGETKADFPKMDRSVHVVKYMAIIFVNSVLITLLLGLIVKYFQIAEVFSQVTLMMFWNNLDFGYLLGVPLFILLAFRQRRQFSLNERLTLIFLLLAIIAALLVGTVSWREAKIVSAERIYLWNRVYTDVAIALNVFMFAGLLFLVYLERTISGPLEELAAATDQFAGQDHKEVEKNRRFIRDFRVVKTGDEIEKLSGSFKDMMTDITDYVENLQVITRERERISAELSVAARIQADMLPGIFPPFPDRKEFDIYASMNPAKEVGGDFYDFFLVDENHLAVVIADVSGKGVPAALFMVIAKTLIKNHAQFGSDPADIFTITNNQLCEGNEAGLFVTAWMAVLNLLTGEMVYVNAGHNPPLLQRGQGGFEYLKAPAGFVLAGLEDITYQQWSLNLEPGDKVILYTDGVTEAENQEREQFGQERLRDKANELGGWGAKELVTGIRRSVAEFSDGGEQFDDITMVALVYRGRRKV